jgi:succinoglycan biosynthesis protein ExoM
MAPGVSVCVATHRRPEGLARLLASLARQKRPVGLELEVLVVDNDADGSAAPVLERWRGELPLRSFCEPRRNIAHARNLGLAHARGRWLAFVDDDEEADEDWLAAYWEWAEAGDADGWLGPVLPRYEPAAAPWLEAGGFHARPRHASGARLGLAQLSTSNAFLRRNLLEVRRFDPGFGRSGGEDTELFARLLRAGAVFRWCDEARVLETIPPARQGLGWLAQRAFRGGVVTSRLERLRLGGGSALALRGPRGLAGLALCGAALPLAALGGRVPAARAALRACTQAGHLWALLGGGYEEYRG